MIQLYSALETVLVHMNAFFRQAGLGSGETLEMSPGIQVIPTSDILNNCLSRGLARVGLWDQKAKWDSPALAL